MKSLEKKQQVSFRYWMNSGEPWIWMNAAAVAISSIAVVGLIMLLAVKGLGHFWPANIMSAHYKDPRNANEFRVLGQIVEHESVPIEQLRASGLTLESDQPFLIRRLIKKGNRDSTGADFAWYLAMQTDNISYPKGAMVVERREWGNFYGFLREVKQNGVTIASSSGENSSNDAAWQELQKRIERVNALHKEISIVEKAEIGKINHRLERLRLREKGIALNNAMPDSERLRMQVDIAADRNQLDREYAVLQEKLQALYEQINRDSFTAMMIDDSGLAGKTVELPVAKVVRAIQPNALDLSEKLMVYGSKLTEFLSDDPREANTEGGIYPAIFGTVMMVLLMSIIVTPFGVVAAVYLREYAKQGLVTRLVRVAVNNLAGVPSIVYGVFGLGFFIYVVGGSMDQMFFKEALPAPTFGTPGLMWASLTLALLTLPVVIVSTEEGLARIPRSVREGSLALGATKAETLWRVVLPVASPAMMTGLILAVARAAGEVAPLMLVGVVKLAPSLPLDGNYPFVHLDQKFMHLGFHIYDVGFQSPNVEAARPLVYATALLLVIVIALLNFAAVSVRNRLREKYKALES